MALIFTLTAFRPAEVASDGQLPNDPDLPAILAQGAWVQALTATCRDETPEVAGHLIRAYDDWWDRNINIRDILHVLEPDHESEKVIKARGEFERLKSMAVSIFAEKQGNDPEDFTRECDAFTKELAAGEWDDEK